MIYHIFLYLLDQSTHLTNIFSKYIKGYSPVCSNNNFFLLVYCSLAARLSAERKSCQGDAVANLWIKSDDDDDDDDYP